MPPSRELTVIVNEREMERVSKDLNLSGPITLKVTNTRTGRIHGLYQNSRRRVTLNLGLPLFDYSRLAHVKTEVLATFLHELRHAHQHDNWTPKQLSGGTLRKDGIHWHAEMEADAERYAEQNVSRYRSLLTVRSKYPVSNLKRLAATERSLSR